MNPKFAFCGYPVLHGVVYVGDNPDDPKFWKPCSNIATPGCAYCDEHANAVVDDLPPSLTADDIVERAERRRRTLEIQMSWIAFAAVLVILTEPIRPWMRTHLQFSFGVFVGAVAEAIAWGVWRWRKGDRP